MPGSPVLHFFKTKTFRISAAALLLLALYALAGFVLAPRLLRSALLQDIPKIVDATPAVGEIRLNPFSLRLEIKDFSLRARDGEKLLGFGRLLVEFELSSLWYRAYSFGRIDIDAPFVNALVGHDGNLNLMRLRPKTAPAKPPQKQQPLPKIRIGSFKVSKGVVTYEDHSRPSEFAAKLQPINFELVNFTTGVDGGRFTFTGSSTLGERVEWHGHLSVQPIESDGEFQIDGLRAHTVWEYLEDRLSFTVNSGTLDLNTTYKFSLKDTVEFQAAVSKIAVKDLAIRPKESLIDWITVPNLLLRGTTVDVSKRQAHADSLSLTGLKLVTWLEPDGSLNLLKLAQPPAASTAPASMSGAATTASGAAPPEAAPPAAAPPEAAPPAARPAAVPVAALPAAKPAASPAARPATGPPWKFELSDFALQGASISVEDRGTSPAATVLLAPLSLKVVGASLDLAKPVTVALDTRVNDTGSLNASGDVTPQPLSANLALKLDGIELKAVQPYLSQRTSMTVLGGRLSGDAKVRYGTGKPAIQIACNISVAGLHTVDNALHDDFINWDRLDLSGVTFQHAPDRLDIEQVVASKLYARVIIEPDTSLNVTRVLAAPGATVVAPAPPGGSTVVATAPAHAGPPPRKSAGTPVPAAPAAAPIPMVIKKVVLHAGEADFADLSLQPNFAAGVKSIEGTVVGLSSKENSRAKVDIHGAVDAFSPVTVSGEVNVLSATLYTDLILSFRNMELSTFNPYSGKFAGYNITKGKLTTEMHYKVVGRKLDAQHHISVDQLEFGAKTASKDAVSLPIKLAVALLKDRNGVINLDFPVSGTLDDPKFQLSSVIWQVFVHVLEKAVTAPFALLGSLFGGGPDLQFVDFPPGAAELDPAAADKVRALVKAMNERPQLKIEVPIAWVGELDRPAMVEAQFLAQVREAQSGKAGRKQSTVAAPALEQMDPAAQAELLMQVYAKNVGGEPKFPPAVTDLKAQPALGAAKTEFLKQALHEHIAIADADLTALGQQRAMAVQQALLTNTEMDPERVFLVVNDKAKNHDGQVRLELSLR
jgi:hypothetical protein